MHCTDHVEELEICVTVMVVDSNSIGMAIVYGGKVPGRNAIT